MKGLADVYNLYLDESETHKNGKNRIFVIAGIIVKESYHNTILTQELNDLKKIIWSDYANPNEVILHEKEIRSVQNAFNKHISVKNVKSDFKRFRNPKNSQKLYTGIEKIIGKKDVNILGACIVIDELNRYFSPNILSDKSLISLQIIMENFCHFLTENNGIGKVFYESIGSEPDKIMSLRFHNIKSMGTMYVKPYSMQKLIRSIDFPLKSDNITGLQIADFIPNDIARNVAGKKEHDFNLKREINRSRYDGGLSRKDKYGVKIIPRII
jgi:hypothetical protein